MHIETERLIIRSMQPSDEAAFVEMASDGSLHEIFGDCSDCGEWMGDFVSESIELEKRNDPTSEYLAFTIEDKRTHKVLGSVGSTFYDDLGEVGVTYFIGAKYRGHRYAAEALSALTAYLFGGYDIEKLIAAVDVENTASCRTLEQAGFRLTETKMYKDMYDESEKLSSFYELIAEK